MNLIKTRGKADKVHFGYSSRGTLDVFNMCCRKLLGIKRVKKMIAS